MRRPNTGWASIGPRPGGTADAVAVILRAAVEEARRVKRLPVRRHQRRRLLLAFSITVAVLQPGLAIAGQAGGPSGATLEQLRAGGMQVLPPSTALASDMKKVGEIMLKEWLEKAGPDGKELIDAYNRK